MPLPYFLATKLSAFFDRGATDPRTSHDLEDITYVLDNRTDVVKTIVDAPQDVRSYLQTAFKTFSSSPLIQEAMLSNLYYETQTIRFNLILEKIHQVIKTP